MEADFTLKPVGVIHSPYKVSGEAPRQGRSRETVSEIEVFPEFAEALEGLESYRYLIILYWMHKSLRGSLKARPPGQLRERGVFATRSPHRPNPIGLCLVELLSVEGGRLKVRWLDALDGSPLLDIKPYIDEVDSPPKGG